jgi:hypothetical protein
MMIFDASNRDQCEVKRSKTNTPLQALVMLNDPAVLEASRVLAANLLKGNGSDKDKITRAFRRIICRMPAEDELKILEEYYVDQQETFRKEKKNAEKILAVGEYPLPASIDEVSLAAMMQVVTAIYNLEEAITKT